MWSACREVFPSTKSHWQGYSLLQNLVSREELSPDQLFSKWWDNLSKYFLSALKLDAVRDSNCKWRFNVFVTDGKGTPLITWLSHMFSEWIMYKSLGLPVHLSSGRLRNPSTLMLLSRMVRWQTLTNRVFWPECKAKTITQREVQKPGNMAQFKCLRTAGTYKKGGGLGT